LIVCLKVEKIGFTDNWVDPDFVANVDEFSSDFFVVSDLVLVLLRVFVHVDFEVVVNISHLRVVQRDLPLRAFLRKPIEAYSDELAALASFGFSF
jgi:hypothetical protein